MRFKNNSLRRSARVIRSLTVREISEALVAITKICQSYKFCRELCDLRSKLQVDPKSKLATLHPFIDPDGVIRVGGKLGHASLNYMRKYPSVLPNKNHLTNLIIRDIHYKNLLAGPLAVLATVRENYWPLADRIAVRRVLRSSIVCFRAKPNYVSQLMGNLPAIRVTPARAFLNTGVDYAGPFNIKISRNKTGKAYLSIFVCLVTKALRAGVGSDRGVLSQRHEAICCP